MLRVLCARPKPWILASCFSHALVAHHCGRLAWVFAVAARLQLATDSPDRWHRRHHHSSSCRLDGGGASASCAHPCGVASIWHAILPSGEGDPPPPRRMDQPRRPVFCGEGSWNVAWDTRPARWLHRLDSAWLLFGVCTCLAVDAAEPSRKEVVPKARVEDRDSLDEAKRSSPDYRVTDSSLRRPCIPRRISDLFMFPDNCNHFLTQLPFTTH